MVRSSERNRLIHLTNQCRASVAICSTVHNRAQLNPAKLRQPLAGSNVSCRLLNHVTKRAERVARAGSTTPASTHTWEHTANTQPTHRATHKRTHRETRFLCVHCSLWAPWGRRSPYSTVLQRKLTMNFEPIPPGDDMQRLIEALYDADDACVNEGYGSVV